MELVDIYDEKDNYLGYCVDRKEAHDKNLWHHHAEAWIMNYEGKVLLEQRAFTKAKNPGKWCKPGGHVNAGETCEQAIKREVYEEIGLKVNDNQIEMVEIFKSVKPNEHYFNYEYILFTDMKENEFILQKDEVNAVKYYTIEEMEEIRKMNNKDYTFCNWGEEGFNKHIRLLKEYRQKLKRNFNENNNE